MKCMNNIKSSSLFFLLFFLFDCSTYAADAQKIILVVGSNRATKTHEPDFIRKLWHDEQVSLDYADRSDIITMDIQQAVNPGLHIVGDAAAVDPSNINTISSASLSAITTLYLERPWTLEKRLIKNDQNKAIQPIP